MAKWARLAAFEGGDVDKLREENEKRMEGGGSPFPDTVKRALILGSPDGARRLFITLYDDSDDLEASHAKFEQLGDEIPESVRGRRVAVEEYEVVLDWTP